LRHVGYPAQQVPVADGLPVEQHLAAIRAQQPTEHVQERALAGTARADYRNELSGPHLQRDAIQGAREAPIHAKGLVQAAGRQGRRGTSTRLHQLLGQVVVREGRHRIHLYVDQPLVEQPL